MIDEAGDKVRNAVAHVFGEAVEAPVAVSVPAAAVAQPEAVPEIAQIEAASRLCCLRLKLMKHPPKQRLLRQMSK